MLVRYASLCFGFSFSFIVFFFFKQKTAYEMRISDWSSDVCSSDLPGYVPCVRPRPGPPLELGSHAPEEGPRHRHPPPAGRHRDPHDGTLRLPPQPGGPADEPGSAHRGGEGGGGAGDRKSVV